MITLNDIKINYKDYQVYGVTKIKNKYGFRIKLLLDNDKEKIIQKSGYEKKSIANKSRDEIIATLKNHSFVIYEKVKFTDYITMWFKEVMTPVLTYNSYMTYRNVVLNYALPFFDNLYLTQINIGHIQKFYNWVASKYKSVARIAKSVIPDAFEFAKDNNLISINPTSGVNLPKTVETPKYGTLNIDISKTLNIEQTKLLINESKKTPIYLHILFALLMGLRKQEINGLKYKDIDFVNRKLYLQRQLGVDPNKNKSDCKKKTYTKQEIPLKTYSSERVIDIPDMVFEAILEERKKYERNRSRRINDKNNPFIDEDYICCSTYGHPRSKGFHKRYYDKLFSENNLPKIKFHELRHTFTTLLVTNNYDLKAISEILGHASTIVTVSNYYDKDKIIIDCSKELNEYIQLVEPKEYTNDSLDINTNLLVNQFI